ncbi:hypothetical protein DF220_03830 [Salinibacterium hongtaonis]|uniref:Cell envelope-related transcriptional attenuator domain-containing protein n=1 Tax=Homoserinimonas hongtaonis TaxID=2079791 RepID=A0A2U1SZM7_9MICO|nr:hypothetical protein DF220_03830 [Salinibacterium hongtaonis]
MPRNGTGRGLLRLVASVAAVAVVSTVFVGGVAALSLTSQLKPGIALAGEETVPDIGAIEGGVNLLLIGSDGGEGNAAYGKREAELNDVTMLMHISEDHTNATVVSFPRDLLVDIPACTDEEGNQNRAVTSQKLNSSLGRGGLACTVLTVEKLTGLEIPYAAKIEMDGVIQMSTAVGGVDVCVGTAIRDRQIGFTLDAGEHTLAGWDALQFLRTRYGVGDGSDLSRNDNQRVFLSALVRKIKSEETLSNVVTVYGLAKAAISNMQMSNSLQNVNTLASIAVALKDIPLDSVLFLQYPGATGMAGSQSVVVPNKKDAAVLFGAIKADQQLAITGGLGNGSLTDPTVPEPVEPDAAAGADNAAGVEEGSVDAGTSTPPESTTEPTAPAIVDLPGTVKGQTAGTLTCSAGQ